MVMAISVETVSEEASARPRLHVQINERSSKFRTLVPFLPLLLLQIFVFWAKVQMNSSFLIYLATWCFGSNHLSLVTVWFLALLCIPFDFSWF